LRVWEETVRKNDPETAPTLANLASLLYRLRRYSEAEQSYRRALALQETCLGQHHTDVAATLTNLASVYQSMARHREAENLYREALNIRQIAQGSCTRRCHDIQ
jgi:tetratricopeptide (TPR) repeat protein